MCERACEMVGEIDRPMSERVSERQKNRQILIERGGDVQKERQKCCFATGIEDRLKLRQSECTKKNFEERRKK